MGDLADDESDDISTTAFGDLLWLAAGRQQFGAAADGIQSACLASIDVAEGHALVKAGSVSGAKAAEKGKGAAPAAKGKGQQPAVTTEVAEPSAESTAVAQTLARRCVSDAIAGMFDSRETIMQTIQQATSLPLSTALEYRLPDALAAQDSAMDPIADAAGAKGKKK